MAHAAKSGINVLVVRLEPVAKRAAQHAGGGARGTTFEYVVFSVEKVGRVARIEGERLESRKRLEQTRSPFPAIAEQVGNTEGTPSFGTVGRRRRIPALKVEVPVPYAGSLACPRDRAFPSLPAIHTPPDASAPRWAETSRPSARTRSLPRGSRRPANPAAKTLGQTWSGNTSDRRTGSKRRDE